MALTRRGEKVCDPLKGIVLMEHNVGLSLEVRLLGFIGVDRHGESCKSSEPCLNVVTGTGLPMS